MIIIPLFNPTPHHILNFTSNHLITQPVSDTHTFSLLDLSLQHKFTHGHNLLITDRRLIHRRTSNSWNVDLSNAIKSKLLEDVIFITRSPQTINVNCGNNSKTFHMSDQIALAIHLPHDCSLSSELLSIPTHNYHASISISQTIHLKRIKSNIDFSTHPETHKDLLIAKLTDLSIFNDETVTRNVSIDTITWLQISAISISISVILWLCSMTVLFFKGLSSNR